MSDVTRIFDPIDLYPCLSQTHMVHASSTTIHPILITAVSLAVQTMQQLRGVKLLTSTVVMAFSLLPSAVCGWSWSLKIPDLLPIAHSPSTVSRRTVIVTTSAAITSLLLSDDEIRVARAVDVSTSLYTRQQNQSTTKQQAEAVPISYQIELPSSMKESSKPVKTHLDEVNFSSESVKGYQYGVTVDPVRISSIKEVCGSVSISGCCDCKPTVVSWLCPKGMRNHVSHTNLVSFSSKNGTIISQFGTPEEVAARVVTAEVNRDGVFEVTLLEDPYEVSSSSSSSNRESAYILEYLSDGKRGKKVILNKICVSSTKLLYVLTAQCRQDDYPALRQEMKSTVKSFQVP
jgi:hypothetical protein